MLYQEDQGLFDVVDLEKDLTKFNIRIAFFG
jgi:hypothetical protein